MALHEQVVGNLRPSLLVLLGAVGLMLLVACANVANLMLARAAERSRELAVRAALGAGRVRVIRQLLTESVVLVMIGGATGLILAWWTLPTVLALAPESIPRLTDVTLDRRAFLVTLSIAVAASAMVGLAPALQVSRHDVAPLIGSGTRETGDRKARTVRRMLIVAQVAVAFVVLVGAALLSSSLVRLARVDPGFAADQVVGVQLPLPQARYPTRESQTALYGGLVERLRAVPGLQAVSAAFPVPLPRSQAHTPLRIIGRPDMERPDDQPIVGLASVVPGYFNTMGIPLVAGRDLSDRDRPDAQRSVIIDSEMARRFWPDRSPLGERVDLMDAEFTVVGVVGAVRTRLDRAAEPTLYVSYREFPVPFMAVLLRSDQSSIVAHVRAAVGDADPTLPLGKVERLSTRIGSALAQPRFRTAIIAVFASIALLLAAIGLGGMLAYSFSQRRREFAVRAALGATSADLLRLALGEGLRLTLVGLAAGVAIALLTTQWIASLLYGIQPTDPVTFTLAPLFLIGVALFASFLPARRAARVDPASALRAE